MSDGFLPLLSTMERGFDACAPRPKLPKKATDLSPERLARVRTAWAQMYLHTAAKVGAWG